MRYDNFEPLFILNEVNKLLESLVQMMSCVVNIWLLGLDSLKINKELLEFFSNRLKSYISFTMISATLQSGCELHLIPHFS